MCNILKDDVVLAKMQNYFLSGGLFNPEMMEHEKVRDLISECEKRILDNVAKIEALTAACEAKDIAIKLQNKVLSAEYHSDEGASKQLIDETTRAVDVALSSDPGACIREHIEQLTRESDALDKEVHKRGCELEQIMIAVNKSGPYAHGEALDGVLNRLLVQRQALNIAGTVLKQMADAIESGNITSPDITDSDGSRRWHEEWNHYCAAALLKIENSNNTQHQQVIMKKVWCNNDCG